MAGTSQSGVQVGRRKPVIEGAPDREILSGSPGAGYGRDRQFGAAPGSCPSVCARPVTESAYWLQDAGNLVSHSMGSLAGGRTDGRHSSSIRCQSFRRSPGTFRCARRRFRSGWLAHDPRVIEALPWQQRGLRSGRRKARSPPPATPVRLRQSTDRSAQDDRESARWLVSRIPAPRARTGARPAE